MRIALYTLILSTLVTVGSAGCDFSEQNIDWQPGDSLIVVGPVDNVGSDISEATPSEEGFPVVIQPVDAYFYVNSFNAQNEYTWTINGSAVSEMDNVEVLNDGEFLKISFNTPGTYTIEVDSGTLSGRQQIVVENASP